MKIKPADMWWYFGQVLREEFIFRLIILGFFPNTLALIISSVIYGMVHLILFKLPMAIICIPFGLLLGCIFLVIPYPCNFIAVVVIHFLVGGFAYWIGLTDKMERK